MICTITVLITTNQYIPTFIMLFLSPLLGSIIAGKISKKTKSVSFQGNFDKNFLIINMVLYIIVYFFNFQFNLTVFFIYGIGAVIGFLICKKDIQKLKEIMKNEKVEEIYTMGEKIKVNEFDLGTINGESIREFLKQNNLKEENYVLAKRYPTYIENIMAGGISFSKYEKFLLYFDQQKLYFFEIPKSRKKTIQKGFFINFEDMQMQKLRKGIITYKVRFVLKDESSMNLQIIKKVPKLYLQKQYSEKLYNKLVEIKNKK